MGLGKSKEEVAKELFEERSVTTAPKFDADYDTVEKAYRKNPPTKPAPKVPPTE